jgi:hypothetical protein
VDYIEPYLALKESFNNLAERHQSNNDVTRIAYQQAQERTFIVDSATYINKMFIVRLDLRTLAGPILGYKLVSST